MKLDAAPVTFGAGSLTRRQALGGLIALGMAGALPVLAGFATNSRKLTPPTSAIPDSYFGMHIHRAGRTQSWLAHGDTLTAWPSAKFGSWRLWDAYVSWPHLEPLRGNWDFTLLDRYVAMAELTRVNILLPLGLTPPWASARPLEKSSYSPGNAAEPMDIKDWRDYVRTVAQRYKGRIRHYELWNEPNIPGFFSGRPEDMVALAREAYGILKTVDPQNRLAAPATTGDKGSLEWLDRYLDLGGKQYLDILSHHFYVAQTKPEAMLPYIERVRRIAARHKLSAIPLWNTESGWWIENSQSRNSRAGIGGGWKLLGPTEAAAYVSRALILGWAAGLGRYYWYSWDHDNMGLIEPVARSLKPAGVAYATVLRWMEGLVMTDCTDSGDLWTCVLNRPDGRTARIVWREAGEQQPWKVPANWAASEVETLEGARQKLSSAVTNIVLGQKPVLVF